MVLGRFLACSIWAALLMYCGFLFIRQEVELEGKHENLRDSREVRRHQLRNNAPTILMKGDVKRQEFEALNPLLLSVYKVCYLYLPSLSWIPVLIHFW